MITSPQTKILKDRMAQIEARIALNQSRAPTGCLLWTGYTQPNGYGYINVGSIHIAAHRAALMLSGVNVPRGLDVCHRCDVRACIELAHLYVGTRKQNMADCTARGRHNKPKGAAHWRAKLTAADVLAIRQQRNAGATTTALAAQFKVNHATISRIARGIWRTEVSL
jgi:hypothetical protein